MNDGWFTQKTIPKGGMHLLSVRCAATQSPLSYCLDLEILLDYSVPLKAGLVGQ